MLNDPENLLIRLGIQMPESLTGKLVSTSDGATLYALSQSGFTILPVSTIYNSPIAVPESNVVLVERDQCGVVASKNTARVMIRNKGQGRFTASAQVQATGVTANVGLGGNNGPGGGAIGGGIIITFPGGGGPGVIPGGIPTAPQQVAVTGSAPQLSIQQQADGTALNFTVNPAVANSLGTQLPTDFTVQSNEAINLPPLVRVVQN